MSSLDELPIGTVTFLFTDIEGSTRLLKQLGGERYGDALQDHQRILREAFAEHGGHEIDTQGDSFFVAFRRAKDAVSAAIACQGRLAEHTWPDGAELRVRMGIHTGEPAMGGERYVGLGVHRAARICAAGHGGQVLVSQTARELLRDDPLTDVSLRDLGEHQLKDLDEPERLYQLVAPGLLEDFPELKTAAPAPFEGREGELAEAAVEEMAKRWRRPERRVLIGAAFAAAIVGTAFGVLLTQGGGSTAGASVSANAVGVIDPDSSKVASEIPVGVAPGGIAGSADAIWVSNTGGNTVSRIDPQTNDLQQTVPVGGGPVGVAVTPNAVWVANGLDGTVSRIDPQSNLVSQTITVGNGPNGAASDKNAVWVTNSTDGTVTRINAVSGRPKTYPAIVGASGVALGFGRVWVVSPPSGKVVALDARSGQILKEIGVGVDPAAVAVGADAVWVANRADGTVSKIDPSANAVTATVPVGRGPAGIAAGPDAVWVTNAGDGTLSRFDPSNVGTVKSVALDNPPRGIALLPQGVYVVVGSSGAEHRGGELAVLTPDLDSIDPGLAYSVSGWSTLTMTNDGLVSFRRVGGVQGIQLVPDLAAALPTPTDGGKTYTFQLRPSIGYSNGKLVQPDDFRRALERVFELGSPAAMFYGAIVGADRCTKGKSCDLSRGIVTDRDARTVSMHLTAPDADLLSKLALPFASAVPAGTPAHDVGTHPVPATGPYRIAEYRKKTKTLRLVRNPSFREWSADAQPQGFPDSISVSARFGFDRGLPRVRAVRRGAADIALGGGPPLPKHELDALAERYPSQLHMSTQFATNYFFLNTRVPPFDDVRVRRAVNDAFDRQAFADLGGRGVAPTCQVLPPNSAGYRRSCLYASGGVTGLDRARSLVRRAGAIGARVTVWVPEPQTENGRYMASVLDALGFHARVNAVPVAPDALVYFNKVSDSRVGAQIGFGGWGADFPSADGFIRPLFSCAAFVPASPEQTTNISGFCDHSLDAAMARAVALESQDPPAATLLWQRIEREILAQAPLVPTVNPRNVDFVSKRVGNYQYHPQWGVLVDQLWVK